LRIRTRDSLADPARAAGDDTDFVLDVHSSAFLFAMMIPVLSIRVCHQAAT
jgi:hypothetical protein